MSAWLRNTLFSNLTLKLISLALALLLHLLVRPTGFERRSPASIPVAGAPRRGSPAARPTPPAEPARGTSRDLARDGAVSRPAAASAPAGVSTTATMPR